ncbi:MAG: hypothetical protein H0U65_00380 [Rubrobacter sp.]|jgi:hypothetical protein|nr:hypothetical protein [Rubrobacter sp.]
MHDFMLEMERERRGRLLEEARMSRMRKSLRRRKPGLTEDRFAAFAKELGRDAERLFRGLAKTGTKERKRNV